MRAELSPIAAVTGISRWKRAAIRQLLFDGRSSPPIVSPARALDDYSGGTVAYWPSRVPPDFVARASARNVSLVQIEDGFLRSAGLGSDLIPPCSIVVDRRGISYDPSGPSDLEHILEHDAFSFQERERASRLIERLVADGIGKYGTQQRGATLPPPGYDLVIGQVDDDRSVLLGCSATVGSNIELLRAVSTARPDARIVYRPHPDVIAGHRKGVVPAHVLNDLRAEIAPAADLFALMARASSVHVLTSLTGFEALLRQHPVIVHGRPFYAGWGLTTDLAGPFDRRTRRLDLPTLVAGALIRYPRYRDPVTGLPCPVETVVDRLTQCAPRADALTQLRRAQGRVRAAAATLSA